MAIRAPKIFSALARAAGRNDLSDAASYALSRADLRLSANAPHWRWSNRLAVFFTLAAMAGLLVLSPGLLVLTSIFPPFLFLCGIDVLVQRFRREPTAWRAAAVPARRRAADLYDRCADVSRGQRRRAIPAGDPVAGLSRYYGADATSFSADPHHLICRKDLVNEEGCARCADFFVSSSSSLNQHTRRPGKNRGSESLFCRKCREETESTMMRRVECGVHKASSDDDNLFSAHNFVIDKFLRKCNCVIYTCEPCRWIYNLSAGGWLFCQTKSNVAVKFTSGNPVPIFVNRYNERIGITYEICSWLSSAVLITYGEIDGLANYWSGVDGSSILGPTHAREASTIFLRVASALSRTAVACSLAAEVRSLLTAI